MSDDRGGGPPGAGAGQTGGARPAGTAVEVDHPEALAGLTAAFARYEAALVSNDVAVLDDLFLASPRTVRYGAAENLYGHEEIAAFRAARPPVGLARTLARTSITTYGRDFGVANTLFRRDSLPGRVGRQSQAWVRFPQGWRVVAAHVSVVADPDLAAPQETPTP